MIGECERWGRKDGGGRIGLDQILTVQRRKESEKERDSEQFLFIKLWMSYAPSGKIADRLS